MSKPLDYNPASPVGQFGADHSLQMLAVLLYKLGPQTITSVDVDAFGNSDARTVKFHETRDGLKLDLVTDREALELAKQDKKERGI